MALDKQASSVDLTNLLASTDELGQPDEAGGHVGIDRHHVQQGREPSAPDK
jgi:hypothetical protein